MKENIKTIVVVHGFFLQAEGWEDVVWGDPQASRLGRASKGILEALKFDASAIMFGTGASEKDGLREGEYTYKYILGRIGELQSLTGMAGEEMRAWLESRHYIELDSQNTDQEIRAAVAYAKKIGAERLILVSSPTHIMRCHQAALSILSADPELHSLFSDLYVAASDVPYAGTAVDEVVIIEPPHRPDRAKVFFNRTARGIFQFLGNGEVAQGFNAAWADLIEEWKKKL
jgi:hypothetical protein